MRIVGRRERERERERESGVERAYAASVSLSAVGVSSDHQSGRGWVENDTGGEGRRRERRKRSDSIYVPTMRLCFAKLSYMNLYT